MVKLLACQERSVFELAVSQRAVQKMNDKAKQIVDVINEVVVMPDVQSGFPDANGNTNVTWCNRALHIMLGRLNGQVSLILEPKGIGWTNANAMVRNARANAERVPSAKVAQARANAGDLIIVVAENNSGSGHVALVCPDAEEFSEARGALIGQAGLQNGIMRVYQGFGQRLTPTVGYYFIPYINPTCLKP